MALLSIVRVLAALAAISLSSAITASASSDPCAVPANAIVAENCLPGAPSTEWDVNGGGNDDIAGFATRGSVAPGETVEFKVKVSTPAAEPYRVDVYRLGYYQAHGARKVGEADLVPEAAAVAWAQPACATFDAAVECSAWAVAAAFALPVNATSGLYAARFTLIEDDGSWRADASRTKYDALHAMAGRDKNLPPAGGAPTDPPHAYGSAGKRQNRRNALREPRASLAFFVVRSAPASGAHGLLFQTADTTWHAYNGYGGVTTYGTFEYPFYHAPARNLMDVADPDHAAERAHKRSYDTPLVTREYRAVNAPLGCEYPALRFLERLGVDVHYATGADLGTEVRGPALLARSAAYLSVGHDEYWSYEQRAAVEHARSAHGVHLNFWSANEAYWAVRFERGAGQEAAPVVLTELTDEPGRVLVCYKETQSSTKLDPLPGAWTGTFRDSRDINPRGGQPENALSGVMFAANAQRHDMFVVNATKFGQHRAWAHTAAAAEGAPARLVLGPRGVLGHEWNEDVDNAWRPAHMQRLSETTVDNVQAIMDWGATFDTATVTHSLALHRNAASGAWTFGAGSVQWSWALDAHHDVNDPQRANKYVQRVTEHADGASNDLRQLTVNVLGGHMGLALPLLEAAFSGAEALVRPVASTDTEAPEAVVESVETAADRVAVRGRATDAGGVVASVEVSWEAGRWHPAVLDRLASDVAWEATWGDEPWHVPLHGALPKEGATYALRAADDSGNVREWSAAAGAVRVPGGEL